jgi:hypothetical protein
MVRSFKAKEKDMRVITQEELASRTDFELAILFGMAAEELGRAEPGSPARQALIQSLQSISLERAARHRQNRTPGLL